MCVGNSLKSSADTRPLSADDPALHNVSGQDQSAESGALRPVAPRRSLTWLRIGGNFANVLKFLSFRRSPGRAVTPMAAALARYSFSFNKAITAFARAGTGALQADTLQTLSSAELERIVRRLDAAPMRMMMERAAAHDADLFEALEQGTPLRESQKAVARDPGSSPLPDIARNMQALRAHAAKILQARGFRILSQPPPLEQRARDKAKMAALSLERRLDDYCRQNIGVTKRPLSMDTHLSLEKSIRKDPEFKAPSQKPYDYLNAESLRDLAPFTLAIDSGADRPPVYKGKAALASLAGAYATPKEGEVSLSGKQLSHVLRLLTGKFATLGANKAYPLVSRSGPPEATFVLHGSATTTVRATAPVKLPAGLSHLVGGEQARLLAGKVENHYALTRDSAGDVHLTIDSRAPVTNTGSNDSLLITTRLLLPADGYAPVVENATHLELRLTTPEAPL